ncbi:MAG: hypothetical protein WBC26_10220, partial [Alphaproteobacteria bacterium]
MAAEFSVERFFSLRDEYERLCKAHDKGPDGFTRLESIEDQVLSCAKYLAEHEENVDARVWLCDQRLYGTCRTELNPDQFEKYLVFAAGKDHLQGTRLLAKHYYGWDKIISPAQIDRTKAMELFEKAAVTGDLESRYDLALVLLEGEEGKTDTVRARRILQDLMNESYPPAFFSYFAKFFLMSDSIKEIPKEGYSHLNNGIQALKDGKHDCADWFRERLTYYTALCNAEGYGCEKDVEKAIHLMKQSAEITPYGDAYFWLKNKGLERLVETYSGTTAPAGEPEQETSKPTIYAPEIFGGDGLGKSSDPDKYKDYQGPIELDKPLTFINFADAKGKEAAKRANDIRPDLTKDDLDKILLPFEK